MRASGALAGILLVLAVVAFNFWSAATSGAILKPMREPYDYYNLLAEGFRHGHLYTSRIPDPALLQLDDPYDPVANAPYRVHDMSYWKGHYYLYFGVAPVLLVFLPFRILTGFYLPEAFVVVLFCSMGFAFSAALLSELRRRWFPEVGRPLFVLLLGSPRPRLPYSTIYLIPFSQFYQVPISCAYAFAMAGCWCIARLPSGTDRKALRWLAAAGTCFGITAFAAPAQLSLRGTYPAIAGLRLRLPRRVVAERLDQVEGTDDCGVWS